MAELLINYLNSRFLALGRLHHGRAGPVRAAAGDGARLGGHLYLARTEGGGSHPGSAWARRGSAAGSAGCNRRPTASSCSARKTSFPTAADRPLFRIAPYISFCAVFCGYLGLAVFRRLGRVAVRHAAFFILAVMGLEIFGVILGGYASKSKWSLYGAMREAAQVVSYEIPLALCVVVPVLIAGTMDFVEIGNHQAGWFTQWNLLHDPFTFVTFWVYATCAMASTNRAPFDLPEAESELVAGFLTEYSGFRWVVFFMAEYAAIFAVCGLGGHPVPRRLERSGADRLVAGAHARARRRFGRLDRQSARHVQFHREGHYRRNLHDLDSLVVAAAAGRPGDDHVLEVLRAAGLGDVGRRDALVLLPPGGAGDSAPAASPSAAIAVAIAIQIDAIAGTAVSMPFQLQHSASAILSSGPTSRTQDWSRHGHDQLA